MRVHQSLNTVLSGLVLASIIAPSARLFGDEVPAHFRSNQFPAAVRTLPQDVRAEWSRGANRGHVLLSLSNPRSEKQSISDIALDTRGNFHGTIVDNFGLPRAGVLVIAQQGKEHSRTARTDEKGDFKLADMKSGNWSVTAGQKTSWVRAWNANIAPPAAKSRFVAVTQSPGVSKAPVVRGQSPDESLLTAFDTGTLFSVGAGLTGITLGVIGISEASEANDEADSAQRSAARANDQAAILQDQLNALQTQLDEIQATLN